MKLYNIFRHAPYQPEIVDSEEVKRQYKYWRLRIFYSMYIGYAFFYFTRKSFVFAMPMLIQDLGFTKVDLGILGTILYVTYGISKFVSGYMSDRSNPRYFMGIGLVLTGIFNILFGFSSTVVFFAIFWGFNGWFQGWGWPPCARLLTHWYSQTERGKWWGIWSTSHNVGGALVPIFVAKIAELWGWRISMFVPGIWCILVGFYLMNRLRDTPQSLGLPSIEKYGNQAQPEEKIDNNARRESQESEENQERELSRRELLVEYVLSNKYIWALGFAYFFVYVIRTAINDWGQLFLYETKNFSLVAASTCIFSFEVGGFFGMLVAGWISDKFFKGNRGPANILFSLLTFFAIFALWITPHGSFVFATSMMFVIGFFIFGPQMLIGVAAAELSHKKAAGTATGFIGWFAYIGAAIAGGYPFAKLTQEFGWSIFFVALLVCAVCSVFLLLPLWTPRKKTPKLGETSAVTN